MQYGISADDLARVVSAPERRPPGRHPPDRAMRDIVLRFTDERRTPAEFEDLVIVGGKRRRRRSAWATSPTITDTFEPAEEKILFNGQRAAILAVEKTKQEDTLAVYDAVSRFVEEERPRRPGRRDAGPHRRTPPPSCATASRCS